jgi:excinuclease ABC subunit C
VTQTTFDPKEFLKTLTQQPGVYRMLSEKNDVLYVGKARNLKRRLANYFHTTRDIKTETLVEQIASIEVTVTASENEALVLEAQLIKKFKPRYNVLLRDDKSYPYIFISAHPEFPRIGIYRGAKREKGDYFGPYPNTFAARNTVHLLYKMFLIRSCTDSFFANRSRPCLQYQIKRCSAPCVGYIDKEKYQQDLELARLFLKGKNQAVLDELIRRMDLASQDLNFELAAIYRDKIADLRRIQEQQYVFREAGNVDIIAIELKNYNACIQILYIREGQLLGNRGFFPKVPAGQPIETILFEFLSQHYLINTSTQEAPQLLLVNHAVADSDWLSSALTEQAGHKVEIKHNVRGERARWVALAEKNAYEALQSRLASHAHLIAQFEALEHFLPEIAPIQRIECFDISHTMGEATVASCVVFDRNGPLKTDYRRFNIRDIQPGDDYAAMYQALTRRYHRAKEEGTVLPDLLLIDGGTGQVTQAKKVLEELNITSIFIIGVAKGVSRKPGLEQLIIETAGTSIRLPSDSHALHLIQQVRDEAHRFAITGHRMQRDKNRRRSTLEDIPGIGPTRRRELLRQFGGLQEIKKASVEELSKVPGISQNLAQQIFDLFHS